MSSGRSFLSANGCFRNRLLAARPQVSPASSSPFRAAATASVFILVSRFSPAAEAGPPTATSRLSSPPSGMTGGDNHEVKCRGKPGLRHGNHCAVAGQNRHWLALRSGNGVLVRHLPGRRAVQAESGRISPNGTFGAPAEISTFLVARYSSRWSQDNSPQGPMNAAAGRRTFRVRVWAEEVEQRYCEVIRRFPMTHLRRNPVIRR